MTHDPTTGHLTDDALIRAAIDRADLTAADRRPSRPLLPVRRNPRRPDR